MGTGGSGEEGAADENHYNSVPYAAGCVEKFGIPPMLFVDGSLGVVCGTGKSTCFLISICWGASFDPELEEKIGRCIGKEVRVYGSNLFAGVWHQSSV